MKPIIFHCQAVVPFSPAELQAAFLQVEEWPSFTGYGPLPGIRQAQFQERTDQILGSVISVINTDGSTHIEEVIAWRPGVGMQLKMHQFSKPLSRLASHFLETWELEATLDETRVDRHFALYPTSLLTWPLLWMISRLLRRAVARHLQTMLHKK
jgi:hypothetical protein